MRDVTSDSSLCNAARVPCASATACRQSHACRAALQKPCCEPQVVRYRRSLQARAAFNPLVLALHLIIPDRNRPHIIDSVFVDAHLGHAFNIAGTCASAIYGTSRVARVPRVKAPLGRDSERHVPCCRREARLCEIVGPWSFEGYLEVWPGIDRPQKAVE